MKLLPLFTALLIVSAAPAFAASVQVTINDQVYTGPSNPKGVKLVAGEPFTLTVKITGGKVADPVWVSHGPTVQMNGAAVDPQPDSDSFSFYYTALEAGPMVFPAIEIAMAQGPKLHVDAIKLVAYPR